jgi:cyclopropane fatty-acyl-phospholipid synthase-like methyltransferase
VPRIPESAREEADDRLSHPPRHLSAACAGVDWSEHLALVPVGDAWPFPDEFFDAVISNQVLEHVGAHDQFFSEFRHTLDLYTRKARQLLGGTPRFNQRGGAQAFRSWLAVLVLTRVSSVTLTLEKAETYTLRHRN